MRSKPWEHSIPNSENHAWTNLCWAPAGPCQPYWSVGGVCPRSGTSTLWSPAVGSQKSRATPLCSTSWTAALPRPPRTTMPLVPAAGGSSGGRWTSPKQKLAQHKKRSHCPEEEQERGKDDYERAIIRHEYSLVAAADLVWLDVTEVSSAALRRKDTCSFILMLSQAAKIRVTQCCAPTSTTCLTPPHPSAAP